MPKKTAAELRDNGFFISGDLGKIDERGYVHIDAIQACSSRRWLAFHIATSAKA